MTTRLGRTLAALGLLLLVPLALRIWPIRHGMPRIYVPDTHMVRQALSMARDRDLAPQAGTYSFYPNLVPYLLLPVYAAEYRLGKARGAWNGSKEFGEHLLDHPEDAEVPARILVALFGALTPLAVFGAARAAGLRQGAWMAAWLAATSLLSIQLSTHERPWAPMTFFMVLACWPAALYARDGRGSRLLASGAAAGLAAACHQGGLLALAIPALAWLLGPLEWVRRDLFVRLRQGAACVLAFALAAVVLGYPHLLRYGLVPAKVAGGAQYVSEQGGMHIGGLSIVFHVDWSSLARLARSLLGYDPALIALGLGGLAFAFARKELRACLLFALAWSAFFMTNRSDHVRYLLPVEMILCLPAGLFAEEMLRRRFGGAVLLVAAGLPLLQALRFDWVLSRPDTRAEAEARITSLKPGSVVAIDRYGPDVDLDRTSLSRLLRLRASTGEGLRPREERRRLRFDAVEIGEAEQGADAVRIEELFEVHDRTGRVEVRKGLETLGDRPEAVLSALGVTHFLLVERRPGGDPPNTLQALAGKGRAIWVIDPGTGFGKPREAFLPTEMDFPITALWQVRRPGPFLTLCELR